MPKSVHSKTRILEKSRFIICKCMSSDKLLYFSVPLLSLPWNRNNNSLFISGCGKESNKQNNTMTCKQSIYVKYYFISQYYYTFKKSIYYYQIPSSHPPNKWLPPKIYFLKILPLKPWASYKKFVDSKEYNQTWQKSRYEVNYQNYTSPLNKVISHFLFLSPYWISLSPSTEPKSLQ